MAWITPTGGTFDGVRPGFWKLLLIVGVLAGCGTPSSPDSPSPSEVRTPADARAPATLEPTAAPPSAPAPAPLATSGVPRRAYLTIPTLGLQRVDVVPYVGTPDDRPGTAIQDAGDLAAPHGSGGLVGPGGIGNFLITGHRTSSTRPFADLPSLRAGDRVVVETRTHRLVYEITGTRSTSFRRPASLRAQSAAVPGHPGRRPTRAMITLSTCATPEDHAAGNFWSDELHNPEHRIDKIGVLRALHRR
jgi:sortase A